MFNGDGGDKSSLSFLVSQAAKNSGDSKILNEFISEIKKDCTALSESVSDNKKEKYEIFSKVISKGLLELPDGIELSDIKHKETERINKFNEELSSVIISLEAYLNPTEGLEPKAVDVQPNISVIAAELGQEMASEEEVVLQEGSGSPSPNSNEQLPSVIMELEKCFERIEELESNGIESNSSATVTELGQEMAEVVLRREGSGSPSPNSEVGSKSKRWGGTVWDEALTRPVSEESSAG